MKREIAWLLSTFGTETILRADGAQNVTVRALVRPMTQKSLQNIRSAFGVTGSVEPGMYLYLGPADAALDAVEQVVCGNRIYRIRRAEALCAGDTVLYQWGLLTREGGADPWNS